MFYYAVVEAEDGALLASFPDCPGCQTEADTPTELQAMATEALEGWLEAHLVRGGVPPYPSEAPPAGAAAMRVEVRPQLAAALQIRWLRTALGLTQGALAERLAVSQQAVARLEDPDANLHLATLVRAVEAMGAELDLVVRRARQEGELERV